MFTGIVEERGRVARVEGPAVTVEARTVGADAEIGASISVSGVCLTVVANEPSEGARLLSFDLAPETLSRTTLDALRPGDGVNLERPVTLLTRLGGHLVQGHVDGVGEVSEIRPEGDGYRIAVRVPTDLMRYVAEKGSVAVAGISLTVAALRDDGIEIALIPHTWTSTTVSDLEVGDPVNLEVDVIAKYVERLLP